MAEMSGIFKSFIANLKLLSQTCNFGELTDVLNKHKVVTGTMIPDLKRRFLKDPGN